MRTKNLFIHLVLIVAGLLYLLPLIWMLSTSLKSGSQIYAFPPELIPNPVDVSSYQSIFQLGFLSNIGTSIFVSVSTTVGQILIATMAGYALARIPFKGRNLVFGVLLATMMVPFIITVLPLFVIMRSFGWIDTYQALIVPKMFSVFGIFFMRQFFLSQPVALEEAAAIDGLGRVATFFRIVLPQTKPAVATLTVLSFMGSWNDFLWPLVASGRNITTLPVALSQLSGRFLTEWNMLMAGTCISLIPILILYAVAQKHVVEGMTRSGIK